MPQPYRNHNGGDIEFGPDGYLYVALGDGGSGGDPEGNGQDTRRPAGEDPAHRPVGAGGNEYGIPEDNPFADGGGAPEVWLYGVRNPWRLTFHPDSGDLWVADVGQQSWEEIDVLPASDGGGAGAGANLGWNEMEGTHPYEGGSPPDGAVEPIFEYGHDEGCSITGGVIYTGTAVAGLAGAYLFADYCTGQLRAVRGDADGATDGHVWEDAAVSQPVSFGVDPGATPTSSRWRATSCGSTRRADDGQAKPGDDDLIHITTPDDWAAAQEVGPVAATMATEGFVHCSTRKQLRGTLGRHFAGAGPLLGLLLDPETVGDLRWEESSAARPSRTSTTLPLDAVLGVEPLEAPAA